MRIVSLDTCLRNSMRNKRQRRLGLVCNDDSAVEGLTPNRAAIVVSSINGRERFTLSHHIAGPLHDYEADSGIDDVFDLGATSAQGDDAISNRARLNLRNHSIPG